MRVDKRIIFLRNRMLTNLHREWAVEEMAQDVNLSVSQLHKLFKSNAGTSPIQYLRQLRLEIARELLENSFERIKEIRSKVGILDAAHFTRDFKAKYGMTPSEYRKKVSEAIQMEDEI